MKSNRKAQISYNATKSTFPRREGLRLKSSIYILCLQEIRTETRVSRAEVRVSLNPI